MTNYHDSEVMHLSWDSWMPDALYVRGHMDPLDANVTLTEFYGDDDWQWSTPVAKFGRWSMGHGPEGGQGLLEYWDPGAGRFPIMVAEVKYGPVDSHVRGERQGQLWSRRNGNEPFGCDCDHYWGAKCACKGACSCHWSPLKQARDDGRVVEWKAKP